jgi:glycosyltransferase involved in cell wall biosynthesis
MTLNSPCVSVVVPTFKRPLLLRRAIESLQAQTLTDWEAIVSDDETTSGETWELLQRWAAEDGRIKPLRNQGKHGQAGNITCALRAASAPWIKVLFDDDRLRPGCLARFMKVVEGRPENIALVACLGATVDARSPQCKPERRGHRAKVEYLEPGDALLALYLNDLDIGIPTQVMVRRACLHEETQFMDAPGLVSCVDLWWYARLLREGGLALINEVLVERYQDGHSTVTSSVSARALDEEFQRMKDLIFPLLPREAEVPPPVVAKRGVRLIRALHRLARRRPLEAARLAASAPDPRAALIGGGDAHSPPAFARKLAWSR